MTRAPWGIARSEAKRTSARANERSGAAHATAAASPRGAGRPVLAAATAIAPTMPAPASGAASTIQRRSGRGVIVSLTRSLAEPRRVVQVDRLGVSEECDHDGEADGHLRRGDRDHE